MGHVELPPQDNGYNPKLDPMTGMHPPMVRKNANSVRMKDDSPVSDDQILAVLAIPDIARRMSKLGLIFEVRDRMQVVFDDMVPNRHDTKVGGKFPYYIQITQSHGGPGGIATLVHDKEFTADELKTMVAKATETVNLSRVTTRRVEMAKKKVGVTNAKETNATLFPSDLEFFEAVMCDKFDFKKLLPKAVAEGEIAATCISV